MLLAVLIRLYVNLSNITISNDLVICQTYGYCFVQFDHVQILPYTEYLVIAMPQIHRKI